MARRKWGLEHVPALVALVGLMGYGIVGSAYHSFYGHFGVSPLDIGLGYAEILAQATLGIITLMLYFAAGVVALMYLNLAVSGACLSRRIRLLLVPSAQQALTPLGSRSREAALVLFLLGATLIGISAVLGWPPSGTPIGAGLTILSTIVLAGRALRVARSPAFSSSLVHMTAISAVAPIGAVCAAGLIDLANGYFHLHLFQIVALASIVGVPPLAIGAILFCVRQEWLVPTWVTSRSLLAWLMVTSFTLFVALVAAYQTHSETRWIFQIPARRDVHFASPSRPGPGLFLRSLPSLTSAGVECVDVIPTSHRLPASVPTRAIYLGKDEGRLLLFDLGEEVVPRGLRYSLQPSDRPEGVVSLPAADYIIRSANVVFACAPEADTFVTPAPMTP